MIQVTVAVMLGAITLTFPMPFFLALLQWKSPSRLQGRPLWYVLFSATIAWGVFAWICAALTVTLYSGRGVRAFPEVLLWFSVFFIAGTLFSACWTFLGDVVGRADVSVNGRHLQAALWLFPSLGASAYAAYRLWSLVYG